MTNKEVVAKYRQARGVPEDVSLNSVIQALRIRGHSDRCIMRALGNMRVDTYCRHKNRALAWDKREEAEKNGALEVAGLIPRSKGCRCRNSPTPEYKVAHYKACWRCGKPLDENHKEKEGKCIVGCRICGGFKYRAIYKQAGVWSIKTCRCTGHKGLYTLCNPGYPSEEVYDVLRMWASAYSGSMSFNEYIEKLGLSF
jgi:hypothetical protein